MQATTDPMIDEPRKRVGVVATQVPPGQRRLLASLESVFPVKFEHGCVADLNDVDAALVLDPARLSDTPDWIPRLVLAPPCGQRHAGGAVIALADDRVQFPLRGRSIQEEAAAVELPLMTPQSQSVLARIGRKPVWWQVSDAREYLCVSAYSLPQTAADEVLRDHLKPGRFMGLLPLLHFLDGVLGRGWGPSSLQASFVIDDPNLHWPSYGYLDYVEMVAHAKRHGYHVGLATVPLDGWLVSRRAASLVKQNPSALSLLMHGNDHRAGELVRITGDRVAEAVIAQALRRTAVFERRSGAPVQRVMAPPHEACSKSVLRAMFRLGLDGACIGQRYPWRGSVSSLDAWPLAKWHPADMVVGGFPIIPRYSIAHPLEELIFRALLRQPLIVYGHHGDFSQGLEPLAEAAAYINDLGEVRWSAMGSIARRGFLAKRIGETLIVQLYSRRVTIDTPEDVTVMRASAPSLSEDEPVGNLVYGDRRVSMTRGSYGWMSGSLEVTPGTRLQLTLTPDRPLDPAQVSARRYTPWPPLRRALVEGRDRLQPLSQKLTLRKAPDTLS